MIELKNGARYKAYSWFTFLLGEGGTLGLAAYRRLTALVWLSAPGNVCLQSRTWPTGKTNLDTVLLPTNPNIKSH